MSIIDVQPYYSAEVALEGITEIVDKSFGSMVNAISNFFPSLKSSFDGAIESVSKLKPLASDVVNSLSIGYGRSETKEMDLTPFSRVNVRVPEGFTGNLDEYSDFLARSWKFIQAEAIPQMDNLYGQLASFASNKSSKISLADTSLIFQSVDASYQALAKESQSYFGKNRHNSTKSDIGTAYGQYYQVLHTESRVANLVRELNPKQVQQVLDKIKRISSVLDVIITDAQAKDYDRASFEAVKGMATGVYAMAQAMEFFSLTYYRINEMGVVCKENKNIIAKLK
jgi:hypothetical protein